MVSPIREVRILVVDQNDIEAQKIGMALDQSGYPLGWCGFAPQQLKTSLAEHRPTLMIVHAEVGSADLRAVLSALHETHNSALPVVLLCKGMSDDVFVQPMQTGVVELLEEPFNPRLHLARLRVLVGDLHERSGQLSGRGGATELAAVVRHVVATLRTGTLRVGAHSEGVVSFVQGTVSSAQFQTLSGQAALNAIAKSTLSWEFSENQNFSENAEPEAAEFEIERGFGGQVYEEPKALEAPSNPFAEQMKITREMPQSMFENLGSSDSDIAPAPTVPSPRSSAPRPSSPAGPIDPEACRTTLLIVDDDPAVIKMLGEYFARRTFPVLTARDGLEAFASLQRSRVDLVIADLNMPRLDGWGLLRAIREDFSLHETPLALFSAQDDYRESLRMLHAGAQAYFSKTLRLGELELQIRELLEPRRRFLRLAAGDSGVSFNFGALGPQWVLRSLSAMVFSGELDANDEWGSWRLHFSTGRLINATARIGSAPLANDRALASFLTSRRCEGTLSKSARPADEGFGGESTDGIFGRIIPWLAEEQRRTREESLSKAKALSVHDDLFRLYMSVGPAPWLPMAQLLCEQHLTPQEVMTRMNVTPMEVAAVVKDLLRRGIASPQT